VKSIDTKLTLDTILEHNIIILVNALDSEIIRVNEICHKYGDESKKFITADMYGAFSRIFCDFFHYEV
jgi:hypothetical protein